jgi:AcrR family transcriptional regulator
MPKDSKVARETILNAATKILLQRGAERMTIAAVATEAGCAKGLVNYHFKTKDGLLAQTISELAAKRADSWREAFDAPTPDDVIESTWHLIRSEAQQGVAQALASSHSCPGDQTERAVRQIYADFANEIGAVVTRMLKGVGLESRYPDGQLGAVAAAMIQGIGLQLAAGANEGEMENAYAVGWLGLLQLTQPSRPQRRRRREKSRPRARRDERAGRADNFS